MNREIILLLALDSMQHAVKYLADQFQLDMLANAAQSNVDARAILLKLHFEITETALLETMHA